MSVCMSECMSVGMCACVCVRMYFTCVYTWCMCIYVVQVCKYVSMYMCIRVYRGATTKPRMPCERWQSSMAILGQE
jgi:hypothetical protein